MRAGPLSVATAAVVITLAVSVAWWWLATRTPEAKPFTRQSVSAELAARYPQAALPPDTLPAEVLAEEGLVFDARPSPALALDVYRPRGAGRHPAVIIVHGGGWERGERSMERPFAKRLAGLGFVAVPVSYRLGPDGRFPNALLDLKASVRWLRANAARFAIDESHIGAVGASSGGQLAALLGATNGMARFEGDGPNRERSSSIQAVVDIDGLVDFTAPSLVEKERRAAGAPTRFLGGPYAARAHTWRDASALTHAGSRSAPTLFINSTAATPLLPGRQEMTRKLTQAGVENDLIVLPNTPHPFWLMNPWFERTVSESARFLDRQFGRVPR